MVDPLTSDLLIPLLPSLVTMATLSLEGVSELVRMMGPGTEQLQLQPVKVSSAVKPPNIIIAACPDLTALINGMIGYDIGITGPRLVGTMATYTCNTGYTLTQDSVRVCQNDRTWSGSTPTCQGEDKINS